MHSETIIYEVCKTSLIGPEEWITVMTYELELEAKHAFEMLTKHVKECHWAVIEVKVVVTKTNTKLCDSFGYTSDSTRYQTWE